MITDMKEASALGAKTARACDSCLRRRARWFCAADDAFLCHGCDNLVHSANQLASRHERVRLQTASNKVTATTARAWHSGFTRKARTPRHNKHVALQQRLKDQVLFNNNSVLPVVPELGACEETILDDHDEFEDQLMCRVPVFDPFDAELCSIYNEVSDVKSHAAAAEGDEEEEEEEEACGLESFSEFLSSEMDLAGFAADVESLLGNGNGIDEDSGEMKGVEAVFGCKGEGERDDACCGDKSGAMVKVKDEEELDDDTACHLESVLDMASDDAFDWNIDSVLSPAGAHGEEEKAALVAATGEESNNGSSVNGEVGRKRDTLLKLNYEEVISAWASQGCPWTTGNPPNFNSHDDSWPNCLDWSGVDVQCSSYGEGRSLRGHLIGCGDGGREARVSRYREKRRTRLFAKKIRYEVRKLNAEKRPRMKGRFVKRACFVGATVAASFPAHH